MEYFHALLIVTGFLLIAYGIFCMLGDVLSWWARNTKQKGDKE